MTALRSAEAVQTERSGPKSVSVAIPCYNEAVTIGKVVRDFRVALPNATVYVIDNKSSDGSADLALEAGAKVIQENRQGKGYVMQAILERMDCDALVVVDGDDTYSAGDVNQLVMPILNGEADMVVGTRLEHATKASFRRLNYVGNHMILLAVRLSFGTQLNDILSGYRVFSRRFLERVPLLTTGFETETELTIQALQHGLIIKEVPVTYRRRPEGSHSKLRPFGDGYQILLTIAVLLRDHRPLAVFGTAGLTCLLVVLVASTLRLLDYAGISTLPASLLSGTFILMTIVGFMFIGLGLVLNNINVRFREMLSLLRRLG